MPYLRLKFRRHRLWNTFLTFRFFKLLTFFFNWFFKLFLLNIIFLPPADGGLSGMRAGGHVAVAGGGGVQGGPPTASLPNSDGVGVKMAELLLGSSPTPKDLNASMANLQLRVSECCCFVDFFFCFCEPPAVGEIPVTVLWNFFFCENKTVFFFLWNFLLFYFVNLQLWVRCMLLFCGIKIYIFWLC